MKYCDDAIDINAFEDMAKAYYNSLSSKTFFVVCKTLDAQKETEIILDITKHLNTLFSAVCFVKKTKQHSPTKDLYNLTKSLTFLENKISNQLNIKITNTVLKTNYCDCIKKIIASSISIVENLKDLDSCSTKINSINEYEQLLFSIILKSLNLLGECRYRW